MLKPVLARFVRSNSQHLASRYRGLATTASATRSPPDRAAPFEDRAGPLQENTIATLPRLRLTLGLPPSSVASPRSSGTNRPACGPEDGGCALLTAANAEQHGQALQAAVCEPLGQAGGESSAMSAAGFLRSRAVITLGRLLDEPRVRKRRVPAEPERPVRRQPFQGLAVRPGELRFVHPPGAAQAVACGGRLVPARERRLA